MTNPHVLLAKFKNFDGPNKAYPLMRDEELCMVLVAFESVGCFLPQEVEDELPKDTDRQWEWLWEWAEYDVDALSTASGLTVMTVMTKLAQARTLKVVYPDGTISKMASQLLRAQVAAEIGRLAHEQRRGRPVGETRPKPKKAGP